LIERRGLRNAASDIVISTYIKSGTKIERQGIREKQRKSLVRLFAHVAKLGVLIETQKCDGSG